MRAKCPQTIIVIFHCQGNSPNSLYHKVISSFLHLFSCTIQALCFITLIQSNIIKHFFCHNQIQVWINKVKCLYRTFVLSLLLCKYTSISGNAPLHLFSHYAVKPQSNHSTIKIIVPKIYKFTT
jgi:hypothetical protein